MEKFARVAISEGIRSPNELTVTVNSELYRTLALHYNRNQQIEVSYSAPASKDKGDIWGG